MPREPFLVDPPDDAKEFDYLLENEWREEIKRMRKNEKRRARRLKQQASSGCIKQVQHHDMTAQNLRATHFIAFRVNNEVLLERIGNDLK